MVLDGDGVVMKGAAGHEAGERISLMFADGTLGCKIEEVRK